MDKFRRFVDKGKGKRGKVKDKREKVKGKR